MRSPVLRFFKRFVLPRWKLELYLLCTMLISNALALPVPVLFRHVIDVLIPRGRFRELWFFALGLVLIVALRGLFSFLEQYLKVISEETLVVDVEKALVQHLLRLPASFLQNREVGYLMARVRSDPQVAKAFFLGVLTILSNALFLAAATGILVWLDWKLALVAMTILPALAFSSRFLNRRLQILSRTIQEGDALVSKELGEGLSSSLTTKLLGLFCWVEGKIGQALDRLKAANVWTNTVGAMAGGVLTFIVELGPILFLCLGAWYIMKGILSLGTVIAFVSFIGYLYGPVQSIILTNLGLQRARVAASRIFEILDEAPERSGKRALAVHSGRVKVERVSFTYPNGTVALRSLSFEVKPGSWVALVGRVGSGKSTLLSLLARLYEPQEGKIYIDGQDLQEANLSSLREQIVLMTQDVFLFSTTVMENLRCGDPSIPEAEVFRVTQALGAHDFIVELPNGYETEIGERGAKLSGGQKQLLALARAVLRRPKILLLDEATSAMDSETETKALRALRELMRGKTVIMAAHRLSTTQFADQVFVLRDGQLVESGTHAELVEKGGEYRAIFEEQMAAAEKYAP